MTFLYLLPSASWPVIAGEIRAVGPPSGLVGFGIKCRAWGRTRGRPSLCLEGRDVKGGFRGGITPDNGITLVRWRHSPMRTRNCLELHGTSVIILVKCPLSFLT